MFDIEFQITHFLHNIFHPFTPLGSLPAGTKVEAGADGRVTLGGAKLPQGAAVVNNPDGSKSISGKVPEKTTFQQQQQLLTGISLAKLSQFRESCPMLIKINAIL